jgi:hypothetical protein
VYTSKSKLYAGTFYADLHYNQSQSDPRDIAVVVFAKPIRGITPAQLPTLGQFDGLAPDQQLTSVGHGGQEAVNQPGGPVIRYLDTREYAVGTLNAVNPSWLRISQNPATGNGGACYGDSGGPNFPGAGSTETSIIAGIKITGDTFCKSTNVVNRLDTESARVPQPVRLAAVASRLVRRATPARRVTDDGSDLEPAPHLLGQVYSHLDRVTRRDEILQERRGEVLGEDTLVPKAP